MGSMAAAPPTCPRVLHWHIRTPTPRWSVPGGREEVTWQCWSIDSIRSMSTGALVGCQDSGVLRLARATAVVALMQHNIT